MSRNYKFKNPEGIYFTSFAVVDWIDVFTKNTYKEIFIETLTFYIKNRQLDLFAYCIMTNHVHLVFRAREEYKPENLLGNIKRYSSKQIVNQIKTTNFESRKSWLLKHFSLAAKSKSNVKDYQFWRHDNHPIELTSNKMIEQKIDYTHNNPVKAGIVSQPEHFVYSSALDYSGQKGVLEGLIVLY